METYPASYLAFTTTSHATADDSSRAGADSALEDLLHQKSHILSKKLEILGAEMWWRLHIASRNLTSLEEDKSKVQDMLSQPDVAANYQLREHQEKRVLYQSLFQIETEQRSQQVECWRDVVNVMRDFLAVWEAHEQSRARAIFLNNVGTGTA